MSEPKYRDVILSVSLVTFFPFVWPGTVLICGCMQRMLLAGEPGEPTEATTTLIEKIVQGQIRDLVSIPSSFFPCNTQFYLPILPTYLNNL